MFPYFLVFALTSFPIIIEVPQWYKVFLFCVYVLFIGLRFEVGGDWVGYLYIFESVKSTPWFGYETIFYDPGYYWINKIAIALNQDIYFVNFCLAIIFVSCLFSFCNKLKNPYLGLSVAFPYLTTVVAMGYTRQAAAIGFELLAILALIENKWVKFFMYLFLAFLFHKTVIFLLLVPLLIEIIKLIKEKKVINTIYLMIVTFALSSSATTIIESTPKFVSSYIEGQMSSSGALIRLSMNLLPAIIFLLEYYRGKNFFKHSPKVYLALSWLVIFSFSLLLTGSTTIADRLALYLIPIQLYVFGNLPYLFFPKQRQLFFRWLLLIIGYSFVVLWTWLQFADHAFVWLPYRMYPFI
ncbi:EpsG family protein [Synechococcus sp. PCC 6716]|nr:EpsG family protein [Synechococcus sp. PCC 6716]